MKAFLSTYPSSLSAFMIGKTHIVGQKPHRIQLNVKVCGSENVILGNQQWNVPGWVSIIKMTNLAHFLLNAYKQKYNTNYGGIVAFGLHEYSRLKMRHDRVM